MCRIKGQEFVVIGHSEAKCTCIAVKGNISVRMVNHRNRLPREAVESPSSKILKFYLDKTLRTFIQLPIKLTLIWIGGRTRQPLEVMPDLHSSVLLFCPEGLRFLTHPMSEFLVQCRSLRYCILPKISCMALGSYVGNLSHAPSIQLVLIYCPLATSSICA